MPNGRSNFILSLLLTATVLPAYAASVKFAVHETGHVRITAAQLSAAFACSPDEAVRKSFSIMSRGQPVPFLRESGDLIFYGRQYRDIYTTNNIYWISEGKGRSVDDVPAKHSSSDGADSFVDEVSLEEQRIMRADLFEQPTDDIWLWYQLISGLRDRFTTQIHLPDAIEGEVGRIRVRLKGASQAPGQDRHAARVSVNGHVVGQRVFAGLEPVEAEFTVTNWRAGANELRVESVPPEGMRFDSFYLDALDATYVRKTRAIQDRLIWNSTGGLICATGFSLPDIELWDVTPGRAEQRLTGFDVEQVENSCSLKVRLARSCTLAAVVRGSEFRVHNLEAVATNDLKDVEHDADCLIVAAPGIEAGATALAEYRIAQGLSVKVVRLDEVFDAFSFGVRDGNAIGSMLQYAAEKWKQAPRYVVLAGDGSLDLCNFLGNDGNTIPTPPAGGPYGAYASDCITNNFDEGVRSRIALGRVPVTNSAEMLAYVTKVRAYENGGSLRRKVAIATDDRDRAGHYISDGARLAESVRDRDIQKIDAELIGADAASAAMKESISTGGELLVYVGHGNAKRMGEEGFVTVTDVPSFTNSPCAPVIIALGCYMGDFGAPGQRNIGERFVAEPGGASAFVGAASMVANADSCEFGNAILESIYQATASRLGDAFIDAQLRLAEMGRESRIEVYQLLGDPCLLMHP